MRATTTWSAASTPSCSTWNGRRLKSSMSSPTGRFQKDHEISAQRAHYPERVGRGAIRVTLFFAGDIFAGGVADLHARTAPATAQGRKPAGNRETDSFGRDRLERAFVLRKSMD